MRDELVRTLMLNFADSTGISGNAEPRRYLWTDAFAVCNFLGLYRKTGNDRYLGLARNLVDQVHHVLGRHRDDDPRRGWISGLTEENGELHPTRGGLRIGKKQNERGAGQPADERLEWDRDGQYFHYLTKWVHALYRIGRESGESRYQLWAAELVASAHNAFTYQSSSNAPKRMMWKMSIDLRRPLVTSMGQHDPLDGLIACLELQSDKEFAKNGVDLTPAIADFSEMCDQARWVTEDALGIGSLLDDAGRLAQIVFERHVQRRQIVRRLLVDAELSLQVFARSSLLSCSAQRRLAFRELGLSIGIHALERIRIYGDADRELAMIIDRLLPYHALADQIEDFWSQPAHRASDTWKEHGDINTVMLVTSLAPEGYLEL